MSENSRKPIVLREPDWDRTRPARDEPLRMDFPRRSLTPLLIGALVYALYRMAQTGLVGLESTSSPISTAQRLVVSGADGLLTAVLATIAWFTSRAFPIGPPAWIRNIAVHVVVAFAIASAWIVGLLGVFALITGTSFVSPLSQAYLAWLTTNLFAYCLAVAVLHALSYQNRLRRRELDSVRLQAQLTTARLDALKAQLHPHFLFNVLHTISELIHTDPGAADAMVIGLARLLRVSLEFSAQSEVHLSREIELVATYLDLQRMRYGDRLTVHIDVRPDVADALVPPMILQPLVENALRHGISRRSAPGTVWVAASAHGNRLRLIVEDDGVGLPQVLNEGVGLTNVRTRLAELFGPANQLEVKPREGGGAVAVITMPLRVRRQSAPADQPTSSSA